MDYIQTIDHIFQGGFKKIYGKRYYIRIESNRITFKLEHTNINDYNEEINDGYLYSYINPPRIEIDNYNEIIMAILNFLKESKVYGVAIRSGNTKIHIYLKPFTMENHYKPYFI